MCSSDGDSIKPGQQLAKVETDKASIPVEAEQGGFILKVLQTDDSMVRVGSVLAWIGDSLDEAIPGQDEPAAGRPKASTTEPTAKAKALLREHGLRARGCAGPGRRLSVNDVFGYLEEPVQGTEGIRHRAGRRHSGGLNADALFPASAAERSGRFEPLSMEARGMMRSVLWHRDEAVAAYLEIDPIPDPGRSSPRPSPKSGACSAIRSQ